jgi:hypothetical protein
MEKRSPVKIMERTHEEATADIIVRLDVPSGETGQDKVRIAGCRPAYWLGSIRRPVSGGFSLYSPGSRTRL